jgi:DnaJ family protein C protein 2
MEKNERWSSIANAVAGKSKRDCVARFKELRAALKK